MRDKRKDLHDKGTVNKRKAEESRITIVKGGGGKYRCLSVPDHSDS